jgi:hypothetical protein
MYVGILMHKTASRLIAPVVFYLRKTKYWGMNQIKEALC